MAQYLGLWSSEVPVPAGFEGDSYPVFGGVLLDNIFESIDEIIAGLCDAAYQQARKLFGDNVPKPQAYLTLEFFSFLAPIFVAKQYDIHFARGYNHALSAKEFLVW